jgi:hypothetical protein
MWFGHDVTGVPTTQQVTVRNTGTAALTVSAAAAPPGFLVGGAYPATIAPGASQLFPITCTRATVGSFAGNLVIAHDAGLATAVPLTCESRPARLVVDQPWSNDLWLVPGSSAPVRVRNAGPGSLTITEIGFSGDPDSWFTANLPSVPLVLSPGQTLDWTVTCSPSRFGYTSEKHFIRHDGIDNGSIGAHCNSIVDEIPEPPGFPGDPPVQ